MGLRGRIYGGFGAVIILAVMVIVSYQININQIPGNFKSLLKNEVAASMLGHEIDAATMDYDRTVKEFLLYHKQRSEEHTSELQSH